MTINKNLAVRFAAACTMMTALCAYGEAQQTGNVFSDAVFWYSGTAVDNGDGYFNQGELRDVRHVAQDENLHSLNRSYRIGYNSLMQIAFTNMPVAHPHACITNASETCIYLRQPLEDPTVADPKLKASAIRLPDLFTMGYHSNVTAVMRFRWEGYTRPGINTWLLLLGKGQNGDNGGYMLGIESTGNIRSYFTAGGESITHSTDASVAIHSNVWVDVAVTFGNDRVTVYRAMEDYSGGYWYKHYASLPAKAMATNSVGNGFSVGCSDLSMVNGARTYSSYKSIWGSFRGQIQQVAIWNRTLTDAEIAEAFGCQSEKLRFGVPDGSSGEFAGERVSGTPEKPEDWREYRPELTAESPSLTLNFTLADYESDLPLFLNVIPTPSSSAGRVSLSVNGQDINSRPVQPGESFNLFVRGRYFCEGLNTLTLTWQGSGSFGIDALALGGSWRLGVVNNSFNEFTSVNRYRRTYYMYGRQTWLSRLNRGVTSSTDYRDNTIVFPMLPSMAAGEHILTIPFICTVAGADLVPVQVLVNGVVKSEFNVTSHSYDAFDVLKLTLADGDLVAGANTIEVRHVGEGGSAYYDYIQVRAATPPSGLCVRIR